MNNNTITVQCNFSMERNTCYLSICDIYDYQVYAIYKLSKLVCLNSCFRHSANHNLRLICNLTQFIVHSGTQCSPSICLISVLTLKEIIHKRIMQFCVKVITHLTHTISSLSSIHLSLTAKTFPEI